MKEKRKANSVKSLTTLYTVVIGVALSLAIVRLIDSDRGLESVTPSSIFLFIALIATLFPFYHGALRHLDDAYIENDNDHIKDGALIIDFLLLFLHGLVFVLLALLLSKPNQFAWILITLISIDVIWSIFVYFGSSSQGVFSAEGRWAIINFVFVGCMGLYLFCNDIFIKDVSEPLKLSLIIAVAAIFRTLVDYIWCRSFYFPKD